MNFAPEMLVDEARCTRESGGIELSLVVPVYNGARTIAAVVEKIRCGCEHLRHEIILVNDGSGDDSEAVLDRLHEQYPKAISVVQLARNYGEHSAVLAGLAASHGRYVAVLDDDGQNPPEAIPAMVSLAKDRDLDVVYTNYRCRKHSWLRVMGSRFNDRTASLVLGKPRGLYLSSFKVMSRFLVDELVRCAGPRPYIDGLILRITDRIGQIEVEQHERQAGRSGYTLGRLAGLWMNMLVGSSLAPLRVLWLGGLAMLAAGLLGMTGLLLAWAWGAALAGAWWVVACIMCIGGLQFAGLGLVGEYAGRAFLQQTGVPPYVVRYVRRAVSEVGDPVANDTGSVLSLRAGWPECPR